VSLAVAKELFDILIYPKNQTNIGIKAYLS